MKKVSTEFMIAAAIMAFKQNGNKVVKIDDPVTNSVSNKNIANGFLGSVDTIPEYLILQAQEMISFLKNKFLLDTIQGVTRSEFVSSVLELVSNDSVPLSRLGIAVWVPSVTETFQKQEQLQTDVAVLAITSNYIGSIGNKVEIDFTPVTVKFVREYNCFRHLGHDGHGNLVGFLNKEKLSGRISGRIKNQEQSKYTKGKTTYLNYVKAV